MGLVQAEDIKRTFENLVAIDSPSLKEKQMAEHIKRMFWQLGIELSEDDSGKVTKSNAGNLYGFVKGNSRKAPVLLSAHMDTVLPAYGKKAVFEADGTVRSDGTTVLGADDLAGVTAIYHAVKAIKERRSSHRDFELLFTTGEELYCKGAKAFDYGKLKSRSAYVLDLSGRIGDAAYAAPTILSFSAKLTGRAAHAGFCPENGVNALRAAAEAVTRLPQGRIDEITTANIGRISGGEGVNIVASACEVQGEIRSLEHKRALAFLRRYKETFAQAARAFGAGLDWEENIDIEAYETSLDSETVSEYRKAAEKAGITARFSKTFGGSDNNVFARHGIEGLVAAPSMNQVHSCEEYGNIYEMAAVAEMLVHLLEEKSNDKI